MDNRSKGTLDQKQREIKSLIFLHQKNMKILIAHKPLGNMIVGKIISSPKIVSSFKNGDIVLAYAGAADYSF